MPRGNPIGLVAQLPDVWFLGCFPLSLLLLGSFQQPAVGLSP